MRPNLINRLKEEWNNLDPVDPLRGLIADAIDALVEAQPSKPVAWPCVIAEADFDRDTITLEMQCSDYKVGAGQHWLSTSPPASKPWVGLTDEEINYIANYANGLYSLSRAIEAKLKEKNGF